MITNPTDHSQNDLSIKTQQIKSYQQQDPRYSFFDRAYLLMVQEREKKLLQLLAQRKISLSNAKILEVGCGRGAWLRDFVRWGASPENICGVDIQPDRIAEARELCSVGITLSCRDATQLGVPDSSFDLVLQSTVFTSVLDENARRLLAREMIRVLRPDGLIVWYDFHVNNPGNPQVRGVGKREIQQLFPNCKISLQKLTLAPPIGRRAASISTTLYRTLSKIKPLCTHYLGTITKL